jgi:hypothetical protein
MRLYVRALLIKTFAKTLAHQLLLKLTKFSRRSSKPSHSFDKLAKGYRFLMDMSRYNREVIQRSRRCLERLAADNVQEVFIYGERDVTEVLYNLTLEIPVKINKIPEHFGSKGHWILSVEMGATDRKKVIIASLVNIEERTRRLRDMGVNDERIVLLL